MRFAAALLVCAALPLAASAQTYRWVDEKGGVHFTQVPPKSGKYTVIGGAPPPSSAPNQDSLNQSLDQSQKDAAKNQAEADKLAQEKAQKQERCKKAIEQLAYLESKGPRRMASTNAQGEVVRDTEEDFNRRVAAQQAVVKSDCGGS